MAFRSIDISRRWREEALVVKRPLCSLCFWHFDSYSHCEATSRRWREENPDLSRTSSLLQRSSMSIEKDGVRSCTPAECYVWGLPKTLHTPDRSILVHVSDSTGFRLDLTPCSGERGTHRINSKRAAGRSTVHPN